MRILRRFKAEVALLTALSDIGGVWPVMIAARRLSEAADAAVSAAVRFLFRQAQAKGDWLASEPTGYIVLAMGKHGAFELNYSSDIDLIVFYDPARVRVRPGLEVQPFLVRLTRDLVRLLQERTEHGYVFRTDLRLRPDPGSTPLAISTDAALNYYESVGQNWERAAMIKARAVAGDIAAGQDLLAEPRAIHLAQVPRFCGHRRHPRHEAADPRRARLRADRGGGARHQGGPRRHPRDRVLRADPAVDRRRPPARVARVGDACRAGTADGCGLDQAGGQGRPRRGLSLPAHGRA